MKRHVNLGHVAPIAGTVVKEQCLSKTATPGYGRYQATDQDHRHASKSNAIDLGSLLPAAGATLAIAPEVETVHFWRSRELELVSFIKYQRLGIDIDKGVKLVSFWRWEERVLKAATACR